MGIWPVFFEGYKIEKKSEDKPKEVTTTVDDKKITRRSFKRAKFFDRP